MVKIRDFFDYRQFLGMKDVFKTIQSSELYKNENLKSSTQLLLFETRTQRNWLIITDKHMYCVFDNREKEKARVKWTVSSIPISNLDVKLGEFSENSGTITFENDKSCLYSKRFFSDASPIERIDRIRREKRVAF